MKKAIYFTDQELEDVFYTESLSYQECEEEDSKEYQDAMKKLYKEMVNRNLIIEGE